MSKAIDTNAAGTIDQIRADRACAGCGFNLYGQTVTKEPHYGLAIARCPECGTVAALQQYPVMTHWVNRARGVLAGLYLLVLLSVFGISVFVMSMFVYGMCNTASGNLTRHIQSNYEAWLEREQAQSTPQSSGAGPSWSISNNLLVDEYVQNELPAVLDAFGNRWTHMDRSWYMLMVPASMVAFGIGAFWSVALLGATRRKAMLVPLAAALLGGAFLVGANQPDYKSPWVWTLSTQLYVTWMAPIVMAMLMIPTAVGVWLGRSFARFVVRIALPPRARVPLGILWSRDGLPMPRV